MAQVADSTGQGRVARRAADSDVSDHERPGGQSRGHAVAWLIAALVVSLLLAGLAVAMPLPQVVAALGSGACIAQAQRHSGRNPRWVLSFFLGALMALTVAAVILAISIAMTT
jgi:thiol:disulfide interchange protein